MTEHLTYPFPEVIDSSMISQYKSCPHKFFRVYLQHLKSKEPSVHLHAGKSFASGIEAALRSYYEGYYDKGKNLFTVAPDTGARQRTITYERFVTRPGDSEIAVAAGLESLLFHYGDFDCPEDSAKSAGRTAGALEYYFTNYPLDGDTAPPIKFADGKRAIEYSFLNPLPVAHPITGNPILVSGRMDAIRAAFGGTFLTDDKTTTSLGATWSKNWDLRAQFTCYTWGCRENKIAVDGTLVRGVSILKTKYDTQQAVVYQEPWKVDRWFQETCDLLEQMKKDWARWYWRHALDDACNDYGGCAFRNACLSEDPTSWLEIGFTQRRWDPVTREEIPL